ncbi:MAG TPA: hypothetical protein VEA81_02065 [Burkholderiaceae bacterium]|nr:hypothetical protein [Burkholderiaceae bacterium]
MNTSRRASARTRTPSSVAWPSRSSIRASVVRAVIGSRPSSSTINARIATSAACDPITDATPAAIAEVPIAVRPTGRSYTTAIHEASDGSMPA